MPFFLVCVLLDDGVDNGVDLLPCHLAELLRVFEDWVLWFLLPTTIRAPGTRFLGLMVFLLLVSSAFRARRCICSPEELDCLFDGRGCLRHLGFLVRPFFGAGVAVAALAVLAATAVLFAMVSTGGPVAVAAGVVPIVVAVRSVAGPMLVSMVAGHGREWGREQDPGEMRCPGV